MNPVVEEAVKSICEATGWSQSETISFMTSLVADSPEELLRSIPEAVRIAQEAESLAALVLTMKTAGSGVEVKVENGELIARIRDGFSKEVGHA